MSSQEKDAVKFNLPHVEKLKRNWQDLRRQPQMTLHIADSGTKRELLKQTEEDLLVAVNRE